MVRGTVRGSRCAPGSSRRAVAALLAGSRGATVRVWENGAACGAKKTQSWEGRERGSGSLTLGGGDSGGGYGGERTCHCVRMCARARARTPASRRAQVTVLLPDAVERVIRVSPRTSVDALLAAAAAACGTAAAGAGGTLPPCSAWAGARRLRGGATLAEAGIAAGDRVEARPTCAGGMQRGGPAPAPAPAPGARVRRGPNWCWGDQDGGPGRLGEVVQGAQVGWVYVRWDSDRSLVRGYRWGVEGAYDVMVAPGTLDVRPPSAGGMRPGGPAPVPAPAPALAPGTLVTRGPSWCFAEQDGGKGRFGEVVKVATAIPGHVYVVWDSDLDRTIARNYRWGAEGASDVIAAPLSITREGMRAVLGEVRRLLQDAGYTGEVSSSTLQDLFKGERELSVPGSKDKHVMTITYEAFHPMHIWRYHYSEEPPTIAVTYTWKTTLSQLDQFMDQAEKDLGLTGSTRPITWWIDIFFNDQRPGAAVLEQGQTPPALRRALIRAKDVYRKAQHHVVFLMHQVFSRGWCNAELVYRMQVRPNPFVCIDNLLP